MSLPDVQLSKPIHQIAINKVGIVSLLLPIFISQKVGGYQNSTATIDCCVSLASELKGTNMSRIPRTIHTYLDRPLTNNIIKEIAEHVINSTEADDVHLTYKFPYFVNKIAPISKEPGLVHYNVIFEGIKTNDIYKFNIGVEVTATNLCPCSKAISKYGAHNQRVLIKIKVCQKEGHFVWVEDLIDIAEHSASCEIFSILKREDEQFVTETAYENPMFVEDVSRACYDKLNNLSSINNFRVEVKAQESIHLHSAFAFITKEL
jgi:GTP cyclohydrolase I